MKYKLLDIKHPDYNELQVKKLQLLYEGGNEIIDNANLFLPKKLLKPISYQARLQCASYKNYLSEIINSYASEVFTKTLSIAQADADDPATPGDNLEEDDNFYQDFA